jgi:hypothetical protein
MKKMSNKIKSWIADNTPGSWAEDAGIDNQKRKESSTGDLINLAKTLEENVDKYDNLISESDDEEEIKTYNMLRQNAKKMLDNVYKKLDDRNSKRGNLTCLDSIKE